MASSKKVCVVGASVSGLVSARELRREGHDVTVMEQSSGVGGQWLYDPRTDASDPLGAAGVHSGVYASLRLNAPRDSMGFSDFPFYPKNDGTGDARRYPGHAAEYLRYIQGLLRRVFGLTDVVRLNTKVLHVGLSPPRAADDGTKRWTVRCSSRHGDCEGEVVTTETEEVFDAVVVASGQYSQPRLPTINGMDKWRRTQLHSHSYRVPASFRDEVVVVVGLGESGKEIALEVRQVAREVHISVKSMDDATVVPGMRKALSSHHNPRLHLQIECLCEDGQVTFADGSCVIADSIIYCTGYDYSFPFLDTGGLVTVDDNRVGPLFEHTFAPALAPSAVAVLGGGAESGEGAAVLRGAGAVDSAGAVGPEVAAVVGGDAAVRRGVLPRQGDGWRAQAPLACPLSGPGVLRRVRGETMRLPAAAGVEEGAHAGSRRALAQRH